MLGVLAAVERDSALTQRSLSSELGIALGLANAYLKRCAKKGLIKVGQAPLNRYAYYLTPKGLTEKSRLTREYLAISFRFFREARRTCGELLNQCRARGQTRLVLAGVSELAEVAVLSAGEAGVEILNVIESNGGGATCAGRVIVPTLSEAWERAGGLRFDAVIVTDTASPQATFESMIAAAEAIGLPADAVLAPAMLRVSAKAAPAGGTGS